MLKAVIEQHKRTTAGLANADRPPETVFIHKKQADYLQLDYPKGKSLEVDTPVEIIGKAFDPLVEVRLDEFIQSLKTAKGVDETSHPVDAI